MFVQSNYDYATLTNKSLHMAAQQDQKIKVFAHASVPAYRITWQSDITNYCHVSFMILPHEGLLIKCSCFCLLTQKKTKRALQGRHGCKRKFCRSNKENNRHLFFTESDGKHVTTISFICDLKSTFLRHKEQYALTEKLASISIHSF